MAVEHSQTPRRQHEETRSRKQDLHDADRQRADLALEPGRDEIDDPGRDEHADQHDASDDHAQQRHDDAGHATGQFLVFLRDQLRVNRDERSGQHAFSEEVLQKVRDLQSGFECTRGR